MLNHIFKKKNKKIKSQEFPGGPVVRIHTFTAEGVGSVPGRGAKTPHAEQHGQKKKKKKKVGTKKKIAKVVPPPSPDPSNLPLNLALIGLFVSQHPLLDF